MEDMGIEPKSHPPTDDPLNNSWSNENPGRRSVFLAHPKKAISYHRDRLLFRDVLDKLVRELAAELDPVELLPGIRRPVNPDDRFSQEHYE